MINQALLIQLKAHCKRAEYLHGGEGDNVPDSAFNQASLKEGVEHEKEHTDNKAIAKEIAKDHLVEAPKYYKRIKSVEKQLQKVSALLKSGEGPTFNSVPFRNPLGFSTKPTASTYGQTAEPPLAQPEQSGEPPLAMPDNLMNGQAPAGDLYNPSGETPDQPKLRAVRPRPKPAPGNFGYSSGYERGAYGSREPGDTSPSGRWGISAYTEGPASQMPKNVPGAEPVGSKGIPSAGRGNVTEIPQGSLANAGKSSVLPLGPLSIDNKAISALQRARHMGYGAGRRHNVSHRNTLRRRP